MLKFHGVPLSVHTRKAILAAAEKNLAFEVNPVIPFQPPAGWDALSPTGKIPAMTDGDFEIADSSVICAYLEDTHPQPALYPANAKDKARALWFEEYCDSTVFRDVVHPLFTQLIIRPNIFQQETDRAVVDAVLATAMPKVFGYLESQIGDGYLVGNRFGIGDIALICNLINFHYLGFRIDTARFPKLERYFQRLCVRPSVAKALRTEQPIADQFGLNRATTDALILKAA
jgi:glutathione S-transferase